MGIFRLVIWIGAVWLFGQATAHAQRQVVAGRIVLSDGTESGEPLPGAGVAVLRLPDSLQVESVSTGGEGCFLLGYGRRKQTAYVLKAVFTGCAPLLWKLEGDADTLRMGTLVMRDGGHRLSEVVVTAPAPPVEQKGDTTIYNVSAYPMPEGSYLEALLRRIPGLSYDPKDHSMKFNGYEIREIMLNGKDFFKGNRDVVIENLPVRFVSQLKVYDKPSEQERITGMKSAEKHYVLDLKTKQEFDGSLLANAESGYGTHKRRDLGAQVMRFKGNGDNFMLNARSTNRNFTGTDEDNISNNLSANVTKKLKDGFYLSGNIGYQYTRDGGQSGSYTEQYLSSGNQYGLSEDSRMGKNRSVNGNLQVNWEAGKNTALVFSASGGYSYGSNRSESRSATFSARPDADTKHPFAHVEQIDSTTWINDIRQQQVSSPKRGNYGLRIEVVQKVGEKGNFLSLEAEHTQQYDRQDSYTVSSIDYFCLENAAGEDSLYYQNRYSHTSQGSRNEVVRLSYTHKLGGKSRVQLSYALEDEYEKLDGAAFDLSRFAGENLSPGILPAGYEEGEIDSLHTRSHSHTLGQEIALRYNYSGEVWGVVASVGAKPQRRSISRHTGGNRADTVACSTEWRSQMSLSYQKDGTYMVLTYSGHTSQPRLEDMVAPTDYSSPLYIRRSNPRLRPSYTHSVHAVFNDFKRGVSASLSWNQTLNSVTRATYYDTSTGGRETVPVNINGNWGIMGNGHYDKHISRFRFTLNGAGAYNRNVSLVSESGSDDESSRSVTGTTSLNSNFRLTYLPPWGNIDLTGAWTFYQSKNSLQNRNTYTRNYTCGIESSVDLPLDLAFTTDAGYTFRSGTGMGGDDNNELLWNLKVSWKFLKGKRAALSAYWSDILGQRKSFMRYAGATGFSERYEDQLRGYVMFSFSYRFEKMQ